MRQFKLFSMLLPILVLPMMASCGDDNDNEGAVPTKGKRITKIIEESQGSTSETLISYDEKGRIIEAKTITNSDNVTNGVYTKTYQYDKTTIILKEEVKDASNEQYPRTHTYTLSGGHIVKDTEIQNETPIYKHYEYDSNGNWVKYIDYIQFDNDPMYLHEGHIINWENGNLSSIEYLGSKIQYNYSVSPWIKGIIFDFPFTDPILFAEGFFGNTPKYLPSEFSYTKYNYNVVDGLVTKITKTVTDPYNDNYSYTSVVNYIWE